MNYILSNYIGITTSIALALSIYGLFISLMQSVNGGQFLNINTLLLLPSNAGTAVADTIPLRTIDASL